MDRSATQYLGLTLSWFKRIIIEYAFWMEPKKMDLNDIQSTRRALFVFTRARAEKENNSSTLEQIQWSIIEWLNPIVQLPALSVDTPLIKRLGRKENN